MSKSAAAAVVAIVTVFPVPVFAGDFDIQRIGTPENISSTAVVSLPLNGRDPLKMINLQSTGNGNELVLAGPGGAQPSTLVEAGPNYSLSGGYPIGGDRFQAAYIEGTRPFLIEIDGAAQQVDRTVPLSEETGYYSVDVAQGQNGARFGVAYSGSRFTLDVFDLNGQDPELLAVDFGTISFIDPIFGGTRSRLLVDSGRNSVAIFAEDNAGQVLAHQVNLNTLVVERQLLTNVQVPPGFDIALATESEALQVGDFYIYVHEDYGHVIVSAWNPDTDQVLNGRIGSVQTTGLHPFAVEPLNDLRFVVAWEQNLVGVELARSPGTTGYHLETFGTLRADFNGPVQFSPDQGWISGNRGDAFAVAPLNLNNLVFAPQAPAGVSQFHVTNLDESPLSVDWSIRSPSGEVLDSGQLDLDPYETKDFEALPGEALAPAAASFSGLGRYLVTGAWSIGPTETGILGAPAARKWDLGIISDERVRTALAVANPFPDPNSCSVTFRDLAGLNAAEFSEQLDSWQQKARFADELLAEAGFTRDEGGLLQFDCEHPIALTGAWQDKRNNALVNLTGTASEEDSWSYRGHRIWW